MYKQVKEFNIEILGIEERPINSLNRNEARHLIKCLDEEICEFEWAVNKGDVVDQVDALIDLVYFALGGLHKIGLDEDKVQRIFSVVHSKNMSKKKGNVEKRLIEGAADAVKPDNWEGPETLITAIIFGDVK